MRADEVGSFLHCTEWTYREYSAAPHTSSAMSIEVSALTSTLLVILNVVMLEESIVLSLLHAGWNGHRHTHVLNLCEEGGLMGTQWALSSIATPRLLPCLFTYCFRRLEKAIRLCVFYFSLLLSTRHLASSPNRFALLRC
jgi:hypothetical protein